MEPNFNSQKALRPSFPSYQIEDKQTKTSDSFSQNLSHNKPNTLQSFQKTNEPNQFLHFKTVRNTIIINNEEELKENSTFLSLKDHRDECTIKPSTKRLFNTYLLKLPIEQKVSDKIYQCGHDGCDLSYKTIKQKISHHWKMDVECQKDTTKIMKMILKAKKIIRILIKQKKIEKENKELFQKYESIRKHHSLR